MSLPARLTFVSGFFYYVYTALLVFFGPLLPVVMLAFLPGEIRLRNFVILLPAFVTGAVLYPLWHHARYGPSVWPLGIARGWAHVFSLWDGALGQADELAPHPEPGSSLPRFRIGVTWWSGGMAAAVGTAGHLAGGPGVVAVRRPAVLRVAQPRRGQPGHLPGRDGSMRYRLVTLIGFVVAASAIAVTGSRITFRYPPAVHETLAPKAASYLGVFEKGSPPGTPPPYGSIEQFSNMARQKPNLVAYYSGWAQPFDVTYATMLHGHGAIPLVQVDPSFAKVPAVAGGRLRHLPALVRR